MTKYRMARLRAAYLDCEMTVPSANLIREFLFPAQPNSVPIRAKKFPVTLRREFAPQPQANCAIQRVALRPKHLN